MVRRKPYVSQNQQPSLFSLSSLLRAAHFQKFPGWKYGLQVWKYFAASIVGRVLQNFRDSPTLCFYLFLAKRAILLLVSASQNQDGIPQNGSLHVGWRNIVFCLHSNATVQSMELEYFCDTKLQLARSASLHKSNLETEKSDLYICIQSMRKRWTKSSWGDPVQLTGLQIESN